MTLEQTVVQAAKGLRVCELTDLGGNTRIVEPCMVYTSTKGKRLFHCYQLSGFSERGQSQGWKNPEVESFTAVEVLQDNFKPRPEYNPFNLKMFPVVHFAIPTVDGKHREGVA
jgi:hypothetical protein